MEMITEFRRNRAGFYLMLILVFAVSLWIGWHDFDPWIPQKIVRENIHLDIRWIIQLAVQYFIPMNILVYCVQETYTRRCAKPVEKLAG
ncbi:MAG: hypothetical protein ABI644_12735 [Arenimonas sp.]